MSRYTVLLGLLVTVVAVYTGAEEDCCGSNSHWNICGEACAPTCDDPNPNTKLCPRIQCTNCTAGCRCNDGYVRDNTVGACVMLEDCQNNEDE